MDKRSRLAGRPDLPRQGIVKSINLHDIFADAHLIQGRTGHGGSSVTGCGALPRCSPHIYLLDAATVESDSIHNSVRQKTCRNPAHDAPGFLKSLERVLV